MSTPRAPELAPSEIHVWRIRLDGEEPPGAPLAPFERARAGRFAFERDRRRYVKAHAAMREILAGYLGCDPGGLRFVENEHGKPRLEDGGLGFNLAHSGDVALLAVGRADGIGVDVEELANREGIEDVAAELFAEEEIRAMRSAGEEDLGTACLACWTRKEAYLKALGLGLAAHPYTVSVGTGHDRARIRLPGTFVDVAGIDAGPGCVAALAVAGGFAAVRTFDAAPGG